MKSYKITYWPILCETYFVKANDEYDAYQKFHEGKASLLHSRPESSAGLYAQQMTRQEIMERNIGKRKKVR